MGHVDGHPLYSAADTERWAPAPMRTRLAHSFIDVLADLHAVDPDAVGLGDLGKRDSYVGRQLSTWYKSWLASVGPAEYDDPRAHSQQRFLLEHLPQQEPARIVHGDYGPHNCLVGHQGTLRKIPQAPRRTWSGHPANSLYVCRNAIRAIREWRYLCLRNQQVARDPRSNLCSSCIQPRH